MDTIPFPPDYKDALLSQNKNVTIRVDHETDKYEEGSVYAAQSYNGEPWGISIRVLKVTPIRIDELHEHGIPKDEVLRVCLDSRNPGPVELINFETVAGTHAESPTRPETH
jgi:uncharacterized protein YqfB (UPF0267 family)